MERSTVRSNVTSRSTTWRCGTSSSWCRSTTTSTTDRRRLRRPDPQQEIELTGTAELTATALSPPDSFSCQGRSIFFRGDMSYLIPQEHWNFFFQNWFNALHKLSNLWWTPNSVSTGLGHSMKTCSWRRSNNNPTYVLVSISFLLLRLNMVYYTA